MRTTLLMILLSACASNKVRPDDQSAEGHRAEAAQEKSEAQAHRQKFDPAQERDIAGGVRFVLAEGAPTEAVVAHMRCHFAWARSRGFVQMPGCPIYLKGISI